MIFKRLNKVAFGICLVFNGLSYGQELLPLMYDSTLSENQINIDGNAFELSTSLYNEFSRKLIFGGEIERELSERTLENQKAFNRLGGGVRFGIEYRASQPVFQSKPDWSWMLSVSEEVHFSAEYTDDFFGLVFIGNEHYLGESTNFSNAYGRFDQFLSIGGGIHDRKTKSFITLNAILPQNFFQLDVDKGEMDFSESGDQIDLKFKGEVMMANSYSYFKGLGAAVNFDFNIPFGNLNTFNGVIRFSGRNIGAYQVHKSRYLKMDIDKSYSGFALNDLIGDNKLPSIMDTLGIEDNVKSKFKLLPGFLQIGKAVMQRSDFKVQSFFGVRMYTNRIYKPMVYAGIHYQPIPVFSIGAQGSFGGYGGFRLGLYVNYSSENLVIGLGTEDVLGAILKKQYGHSGLIRLAWKF